MMVRALTFRKCFAQSVHKENSWAILGHMDEMECGKPEPMSLSGINQFNDDICKRDSAEAYHFVIYLIDNEQQDGKQQKDKELWRNGNPFLSVSRIHFQNAVNLRKQFERLAEHFTTLASCGEYGGISWRAYYTIEMSDMILVSNAK